MNKEFIPYEQALELKELGFDEPCFAWYNHEQILFSDLTIGYDDVDFYYTQEDMISKQCIAPLYQQAFRWFREKYELSNWVYTSNNKMFWYSILKDGRMIVRDYSPFNSYEEAELACLLRLIELVKKKL